MMIRTYPHPIRKRPRRFHKFIPYLSLENDCGDCNICSECMANYAEQAENERPGHAWAIEDGKVIFIEDKIAESMLGRPLNANEVVVHKDSDPFHNTRANLEIVTIPDMGDK